VGNFQEDLKKLQNKKFKKIPIECKSLALIALKGALSVREKLYRM
jgi:hypothetical protein